MTTRLLFYIYTQFTENSCDRSMFKMFCSSSTSGEEDDHEKGVRGRVQGGRTLVRRGLCSTVKWAERSSFGDNHVPKLMEL